LSTPSRIDAPAPIRFTDGTGYEQYMGAWSQAAGDAFLQWLAPPTGLRWLDVGCGNGAFTERLALQTAAGEIHGIDPSEEQLSFARRRATVSHASFCSGDAMALPFEDNRFDAAVMPLVIFFVPDPALGVAEMARVVAPGGVVSAYAWDMEGGGFPYAALHDEMRDLELTVPWPPRPDASRLYTLKSLWEQAGLTDIDTTTITVHRMFTDFDDYWQTIQLAPSTGSMLSTTAPVVLQTLERRMRARLRADRLGRISCTARANAVRGRVQR